VRPLGGLLAALALACPAPAAFAAPPAPATAAVMLAAPLMQVGEARRYRVDSDSTVSHDGRQHRETNSQIFDFRVVGAANGKLVIEDTLVASELSAGETSYAGLMLQAAEGLPIAYVADASGKPLDFVDLPGLRASVVERLRALEEQSPELILALIAQVQEMNHEEAMLTFLSEPRAIADMQAWPPISGSRLEDEPWTVGSGDTLARLTSWREVDADAGVCRVGVRRVTMLDPKSPVAQTRRQFERLETAGVLSLADGWIVQMTQTRDHGVRGVRERLVQKFTRLPADALRVGGPC
jgi:hypothetical protein